MSVVFKHCAYDISSSDILAPSRHGTYPRSIAFLPYSSSILVVSLFTLVRVFVFEKSCKIDRVSASLWGCISRPVTPNITRALRGLGLGSRLAPI